MYRFGFFWLVIFTLVACWPSNCAALSPDEVLVIANRNSAQGVRLARYYIQKRGIPEGHLLLLEVTEKEQCSRQTYNQQIAGPVRQYLKTSDPMGKIRCLLTVYGVPLKIAPPGYSAKTLLEVTKLKAQRETLRRKLKGLKGGKKKEKDTIQREITALNRRMDRITRRQERAAVDSELALVTAGDYDLSGWVANPHFVGFKSKSLALGRHQVKLVSRLDGPTPAIVERIIDDAITVEKRGLTGTAYFDARWKKDDPNRPKGYAFYDQSIHQGASRLKKSGRIKVVLNQTPALFKAGEAPNAALYCGWYSLGKYVAAFQWQQGAVGYHIASAECQTLKKRGSRVWCKRMLEEGVAATVGPTTEPYVQSFPLPEIFFALLVEGRYTLAQCYAASVPFWSWQMVLIGDPLYRPFKIKTASGR